MIYILVFILLLIPVIRYDLMAKSGGERGWYYFSLVVLILLAGLRYSSFYKDCISIKCVFLI